MRQVLSILVQNQPGVLVRVASMFARRGFNIESLAVGVTERDDYSRITAVVAGAQPVISQVVKQLEKLSCASIAAGNICSARYGHYQDSCGYRQAS